MKCSILLPGLLLAALVVVCPAQEVQITDQAAPVAGGGGGDVTYEVCEDCCDCCCPSWCARVGYVHLWRERIGSDFAIWETGNGAAVQDVPLYTADRFDFDGDGGIDASLVWDNGCGQGWEVRYLGLDEIDASETLTFLTGSDGRPATNPDTDDNLIGTFNFQYRSEVQSLELLCVRQCCQTRYTYGFRYFELDELLSVQSVPAGNTLTAFAAQNRLFGFQTGLDHLLWDDGCGWQLRHSAKAGVYYNDVDASSIHITGGTTQGAGQASEGQAAFVGELGLNANYEVNCCLTLRAGYQLLYIDGVALAADQVPNTGNLNLTPTIPVPVSIDSSSLLLHGLNISVERCW